MTTIEEKPLTYGTVCIPCDVAMRDWDYWIATVDGSEPVMGTVRAAMLYTAIHKSVADANIDPEKIDEICVSVSAD